MARFEVPDGWTVQAFQFALDCTPEQAACVRRQFGGRRYARNWAVATLKEDLARYRETGEQTDAPSLAGLRKRWNQVKDTECVDAETGQGIVRVFCPAQHCQQVLDVRRLDEFEPAIFDERDVAARQLDLKPCAVV